MACLTKHLEEFGLSQGEIARDVEIALDTIGQLVLC